MVTHCVATNTSSSQCRVYRFCEQFCMSSFSLSLSFLSSSLPPFLPSLPFSFPSFLPLPSSFLPLSSFLSSFLSLPLPSFLPISLSLSLFLMLQAIYKFMLLNSFNETLFLIMKIFFFAPKANLGKFRVFCRSTYSMKFQNKSFKPASIYFASRGRCWHSSLFLHLLINYLKTNKNII